ncbi:MAG: hypothetical protein KBD31_02765 [Proteobacteria bacterium]|nr:hypothetical protein [Pseudomonadota bacterium]
MNLKILEGLMNFMLKLKSSRKNIVLFCCFFGLGSAYSSASIEYFSTNSTHIPSAPTSVPPSLDTSLESMSPQSSELYIEDPEEMYEHLSRTKALYGKKTNNDLDYKDFMNSIFDEYAIVSPKLIKTLSVTYGPLESIQQEITQIRLSDIKKIFNLISENQRYTFLLQMGRSQFYTWDDEKFSLFKFYLMELINMNIDIKDIHFSNILDEVFYRVGY